MKKWIAAGLVAMMTASAGAAPLTYEAAMKAPVVQSEKTTGLSLEEYLAALSAQSGLLIVAVPEIATMTVEIEGASPLTVEEALAKLKAKYGLTAKTTDKGLLLFKGEAAEDYFAAGGYGNVPALYQSRMEMKMASVAPSPGFYLPPAYDSAEEYKGVTDNSFQQALTSPLSTFSIDVDTASYSNIRRFINLGSLPSPDAVRTEEMLNYFTYDYPQPTGGEPFSVTTEVGACPWNIAHKLVLVGLQGKALPVQELPPSNLVFLIDVSGSMHAANKLPLLKTSFKMLTKQLRPQDTVSIVVYAGAAGVVLKPTPGDQQETILRALDGLQAGGSTAGGEGLRLAYKMAKENFRREGNNRVILATDGDFNVGVRSEGELTQLIESERDSGVYLSVLGFGMGNVKDNKMELLADKGNGNYAYIDNALEAKKVLGGQLAGTLYTIAKDVKLQVEFNPAHVKSYRLIGYENRALNNSDFNNDKKDAGDLGAGQAVTALYEIIPADSPERGGEVDPLLYQRPELTNSADLLQVKLRYKQPGEETSRFFSHRLAAGQVMGWPSENMNFAAAVAEYGMLLRQSEFKGQSSYSQVLSLAQSALGNDPEGYRAEFVRLVRVSQVLGEK